MGLLDSLKKTVVGSGETDRSFRYHCQACDTKFEKEQKSASGIACPECNTRDPAKIFKM